MAYKYPVAGSLISDMNPAHEGTFYQGYASVTSTLAASAKGSFAQGYVKSSSDIAASANGSFAQGYVYGGYIQATGIGSFAQGRTNSGYIKASGTGSFARGSSSYAYGYGYIQATGNGSFAHGYANGNTIAATAVNATQFGVGTNNVASSLQVGGNSNIRATGSLFLKEKANADADVAAWGQLWINTATPNELYFTDDAGTDHKIAFA